MAGCGRAGSGLKLPMLQVSQPLNGTSVASSSVVVAGVTDQASILLNGRAVATPGGELRLVYPLEPGRNLIDLSAGNEAGTTTVRLEVMRQ